MAAENNVEDIAQAVRAALAPGSNFVSLDSSDYVKYWDERFKTNPNEAAHDWQKIVGNLDPLKKRLENLSKAQRNEAFEKIREIYNILCE
ncbi:hypothetical protein Plec18170_009771 [Paecilomyces lecythidis]